MYYENDFEIRLRNKVRSGKLVPSPKRQQFHFTRVDMDTNICLSSAQLVYRQTSPKPQNSIDFSHCIIIKQQGQLTSLIVAPSLKVAQQLEVVSAHHNCVLMLSFCKHKVAV